MVFKELVALLINKDGSYTCSNDLQEELSIYQSLQLRIQQGVDRARELNPDWTDERLHQYAYGGNTGQTFLKAKACLDSLGYDTSTLPQVVIPEFPIPGMAGLITAGTMSGLLAYMKAKNWFYNRKDSESK